MSFIHVSCSDRRIRPGCLCDGDISRANGYWFAESSRSRAGPALAHWSGLRGQNAVPSPRSKINQMNKQTNRTAIEPSSTNPALPLSLLSRRKTTPAAAATTLTTPRRIRFAIQESSFHHWNISRMMAAICSRRHVPSSPLANSGRC